MIEAWSAVRAAVSARVDRFLTSPHWRRTKLLADRVLLVAVVAAIGWAVTNGVFVAQRAATNRALAIVHLSGAPAVKSAGLTGKAAMSTVPPTVVLSGDRTAHVSIGITNDGVDGVTLKGGTLTGPYLSGSVRLAPSSSTGYIAGHGTAQLVGTVTVNCDAALPVTHAFVAGQPGPVQQATAVAVSVNDTNGAAHSTNLTVDTTAFAIQGRVCTR